MKWLEQARDRVVDALFGFALSSLAAFARRDLERRLAEVRLLEAHLEAQLRRELAERRALLEVRQLLAELERRLAARRSAR